MKEKAEVFTGKTAAMRAENRWLGAEDIFGYGDVKVVIEAVMRYMGVKFEDGRVKDNIFALRFVGKKKEMILSPTKRRPIVKALGTDVRKWIGQTIQLYVDTDVRKPGTANEKTWGIRVREVDVTQPPPPAPKPEPPADDTLHWLSIIAPLQSIASCAALRAELLPTCPESIRPAIEKALEEKEATLKGIT